jgi:mono/diheme cytochrome c family protein
VALANGCIGCHALDPAAQMTGPTWYNLGNTAVTRIEGMSPAAYLHESIVATNDYIVDGYPQGVMPQNYGDTLSADDLNTLVAYLLAQQQETE